MDADAKEDSECILELLSDAGMQAVMLDDRAPGVPEGVFEVRVPTADAARAEQLIAENPLPDESEEVDPSSELDLETIASAVSEMEAMASRISWTRTASRPFWSAIQCFPTSPLKSASLAIKPLPPAS